jgi:thioredoxin-related protein
MKTRKIITLTVLTIVVLFVYYSINAAPLVSDEEYTYISGVTWYKTYDEGTRIAREQGKPMFVYFWAIWCKFCEKLHTEVYPDPDISKILKEDLILVAVDLDENKEDARRFGVQFPPNLIFFTSEGEIITRISGFVPKKGLLPVLEKIVEGHTSEVESPTGELPQTRER